MTKKLSAEQQKELLSKLKERFEHHMIRHKDLRWEDIQAKIASDLQKLWSLYQMEKTGGEPDVIDYDEHKQAYVFCDCSPESPKGRRSICYDREGLEARKKHKPANNAIDMATEMGIDILTEAQYRKLQKIEAFDMKSSSWIKTPADIREHGGALFCDYRYGHVFVYHNGASSYYGVRGFRGSLHV